MLDDLTKALGVARTSLASDTQIAHAWSNLPRLLEKVPPHHRNETMVRMCVAVSTGLFDAAINYVWNSAVTELRDKVRRFGLTVVHHVTGSPFDEDALLDLKDAELLNLCLKLNLISEDGFFFLDQCRATRNNFSAAHPSMGTLDEDEFLNYLSRCAKHALLNEHNARGVDLQAFITAIKASTCSKNWQSSTAKWPLLNKLVRELQLIRSPAARSSALYVGSTASRPRSGRSAAGLTTTTSFDAATAKGLLRCRSNDASSISENEMSTFRRALRDLTIDDISELVRDEAAEDSSLELKQAVEFDTSGRVRDGSRNDIARELVAFANSEGGILVLGIRESDDEPHRAAEIVPLDDCHELAERLRRAVYEIIEPKLHSLQAKGISTKSGETEGVVVFGVPQSRSAPHRVESLKECFRRVGHETRKMTMREIHELTLGRASEMNKVAKRFAELEETFDAMIPRLSEKAPNPLANRFTARLSAVPLGDVSLGRIVGRSDLAPVTPSISYKILNQDVATNYPWGREPRTGAPIVRGERRQMIGSQISLFEEIYADGALTLANVHHSPQIFFGWLLSLISAMLVTVDKLREAAGAFDIEYAIKLELKPQGQYLKLGLNGYVDDEYRFRSPHPLRFPTYSYGGRSDRQRLVDEIAQDILHAVGADIELTLGAEIIG